MHRPSMPPRSGSQHSALKALTVVGIAALMVSGCATDRDGIGATDAGPSTTHPSTTHPSTTHPSAAGPTTSLLPTGDARALFDAACTGGLAVEQTGQLPTALSSVSGLAASRVHPRLIWSVEDSFEPAELVALEANDGEVTEVASIRVEGGTLTNLDWEDLAVAVDPAGRSTVYIGDIGDNLALRRNVRIYRFAEPSLTEPFIEPEVLVASFPDGPHNAEALLVDDHGIWIITKDSDRTAVYRLIEGTEELELAGVVDLDGEQVSAVDRSSDGRVIAVRTDAAVRLYATDPGTPLIEAMAATPCMTPDPGEVQGESVAFTADGSALLTVSEDESGGAVELHLTRPERG